MTATSRWGALATLTVALAVTPWPLGSRSPEAALGAAAALILVGGILEGLAVLRGHRLVRTQVDLPALAFLGWTGAQWLLDSTVYAFATTTDWLKILGTLAAFRLAVVVAADTKLRRWLAEAVIVVTAVVSGYALVEHFAWNDGARVMSESVYGGTFPWGPFNNRNSFAGYALPGLRLALGVVLLPGKAWMRVLAVVALPVGLASLLASLSRSGIVAFGIAAVGALAFTFWTVRGFRVHRGRRALALGFALLVVAALAAGALWGLGRLGGLERVEERIATLGDPLSEASATSRLQIWRDTLPMIADRPIAGFGLGTFVWAHLSYRTPLDSSFPQHAHNEYLEIAAETGLVGAGIVAWLVLGLLGGLLARARAATGTLEAGLQLGCVAAWLAILAYGMVDFPTVAYATDLVLAVVAGIALAPAQDPPGPS